MPSRYQESQADRPICPDGAPLTKSMEGRCCMQFSFIQCPYSVRSRSREIQNFSLRAIVLDLSPVGLFTSSITSSCPSEELLRFFIFLRRVYFPLISRLGSFTIIAISPTDWGRRVSDRTRNKTQTILSHKLQRLLRKQQPLKLGD